jgi:hypothetical protein
MVIAASYVFTQAQEGLHRKKKPLCDPRLKTFIEDAASIIGTLTSARTVQQWEEQCVSTSRQEKFKKRKKIGNLPLLINQSTFYSLQWFLFNY